MTNCININDPQYKNLLQLAETAGKNSVDLYLDTTRFNDFFDRFPVNIEELNNGIDFIKGSDNLSDDISKTILINSPAIERTKTNLYTFSVAEGSNRIKSLEQAYMVAKRLANKVNSKFVTTAQRPIARVSGESGIVKIIIELNTPVINSYIKNFNIDDKSIIKSFNKSIYNTIENSNSIFSEIFNNSTEKTNSRTVLEKLKENTVENSDVNNLIKKLKNLSFDVVFEKEFPERQKNSYMYISNADTIHLNLELINDYSTETFITGFLHEVVHGYTLKEYYQNNEFRSKIDNLFNKAKSLSDRKDFYGFTETEEFISELYTNTEFYNHVINLKGNIWEQFKKYIKDLLNIRYTNLTEEAVQLIDEVIETQNAMYNNEMLENYIDQMSDYGIKKSINISPEQDFENLIESGEITQFCSR